MKNDSHSPDGKSHLDVFFEVIDAIEEDIAELSTAETEVVGAYECLFISFSNLREYCREVGIRFGQIEDQYQATLEQAEEDESLEADFEDILSDEDERGAFLKLLELSEKTLSAYENRCKQTGDLFDEWGCVLILHTFLRKYCGLMQLDYDALQEEVSKLHEEMTRGEDPEDLP